MNAGSLLAQAAQDSAQGAGQNAFQLVLALGGSAALAALISGFFARRKTGADAASVLSSASMAQVQSYRTEVTELKAERDADEAKHKAEMTELRGRVDSVELQAEEDRKARREMVSWARTVIDLLKREGVLEKFRQAGVSFPAPPPGVSDSGGHRTVKPSD